MQVCSKCGIEKPLEDFPKRRDRPSGHGTICLAYGRIYRKAHYLLNRPYYIGKARLRRAADDARLFEFLIDYLRTHPCVDCGETDVRVLQFDHIDPATKLEAVSRLMRGRVSLSVLVAEMQKCEIRCGNCHRRRTMQQRRGGEIREESVEYSVLAPIELVWAVSSVDRAATF